MRRAGLLLLAAALAGRWTGCATLPDVHGHISRAEDQPEEVRVTSGGTPLLPEESEALLRQLGRESASGDLLERLASVTGAPLTAGNEVTLLVDGPATFAAMFDAIGHARERIDFETFIIEDDDAGQRLASLLLARRAAGVAVNVIHDSVGSAKASAAFFRRLQDGGLRVVEFNRTDPFQKHGKWALLPRDHRKILVVDGEVAFTGGVNVTADYSSAPGPGSHRVGGGVPWRDTDVEIRGPAVAELERMFLANWKEQRGPPLPEVQSASPPGWKGSEVLQVVGSRPGKDNRTTFLMYAAAIELARRSIHLTNAYFIPDRQVLQALAAAARRGVEVVLVLPSRTDSRLALNAQRYTYDELLEAGVRIFERTDAVLHAKTAVVDGAWSTVGSTNMDYLSFLSNDEVNVVVLGHSFADELETVFRRDLAASREIRAADWHHRTVATRLEQWWAHLFLRWL